MVLRSRRAIDACGIACLLVLATFTFFGVWEPARKAGAATRTTQEEMRAALLRLAEVNQSLERASARANAARGELETMPRLEPVRRLNARLRLIGEVAEASAVRIIEVLPGEPKPLGRTVQVPIRVSGRGSYIQFSGFLSALHSRMPDLGIERLRIEADRTGSASDTFSVQLVWNGLRDQSGSADGPG
jgi:Tfp pilus assembly protein PilO